MSTIEVRLKHDGKSSYRAKVRVKGQPERSATFTRKTDAARWAEEQRVELRNRRHFPGDQARNTTLGTAIDLYIARILPTKPRNARSQEPQLRWWKTELGATLLFDLTPPAIAACRDKLLSRSTPRGTATSPATAVRYLAALSHVLSICEKEWELIESNPMRRVRKPKEPRGRVRYLTDDELRKLSQACEASRSKHLHTIFVLAISTGMRLGEIRNIRCSAVDVERGRIVLEHTKNGERRAVHLAGLALELVKWRVGELNSPDALLFPGTKPDRPIDITKAWSTAVETAGIKDFRFHDTRHCAATYLLEAGASTVQLAELLGHKTLQMVKRYAHLSDGSGAHLIAKMNAAVSTNLAAAESPVQEVSHESR
jgi:integrase